MSTCEVGGIAGMEGGLVEMMNDWRYKVEWQKADEQAVRYEVMCRRLLNEMR